jgi:tRNA threonylcarbamoyladenosine biosynthesis protein TsaE
MEAFTYQARDEEATAALGRAMAELLPGGTVVALCGTLGAGKTRLVQAIAEACGIDRREVVSPTFVLIQEHHGRRTVYHLDAYRLRDEEEFLALGPEEYFESDGLTLIEWADRVASCLPDERCEVDIQVTGEQSRRIVVRALGERCAKVLPQLMARLGLE